MIELFRSVATAYIRRRIVVALGLIGLSSMMTALAPLLLKFVVDEFSRHPTVALVSVSGLIAVYVFVQWLGRIAGELRNYVHGQVDRRLHTVLSDRLFSHVLHLPLRFHLERQTGAINETLSNGLLGCQLLTQTAVGTVLPVLIQLGTVAVVLGSIHQPFFLLLFLAAMACYGAVFARGAVMVTRAARGASSAQIEARAVMTDSVLNYETIKYFTAESIVRDRLEVALGRTESEWLRFFRSRALNGALAGTVFAAFLATTVFHAAREVAAGHMTVGDFVLVNTYMIQLVAPLEQLGYATQALAQGYAFVAKMLDVFREKPEAATTAQATQPRRGSSPAALTFEHVGLAYRAGRTVLQDISFELASGKTLGIVGASGAGKSTLVRLLARLIEPDSGRILLNGVPVSDIELAKLRGAIAIVPQDTVLFNDTIGYNIGFGKIGSTQTEIEAAARLAHLHEQIVTMPEGYATRVGERGVKLSGGERQRVSIARAALKSPLIYVFDEATSSLDSRTEQQILANLRELSRQATTLIVAHRLSTVVHADEIIVLHKGLVVERGTHEALLERDGRYAALWRAQLPQAAAAS